MAKTDKTPQDNLNEDGTPAAETLKQHQTTFSRSQLMANVVETLGKMNHDDLTHWFTSSIENSKHYSDKAPAASDKNKSSVSTHPSGARAQLVDKLPDVQIVREDLEKALSGEDGLSPELREKAITLFEAAVNTRVGLERVALEEAMVEQFDEELEGVVTELTEKVDEYLNYAATNWAEENEVAIESSLKLEMFDAFMDGLRDLFTKHYIEIPEEKVDVVAELTNRVASLEEDRNKTVDQLIAVQAENDKLKAGKVFDEAAKGLTEAQIVKFKTLTESVDYDGDDEKLKRQLDIIKDSHFKETKKKSEGTGILSEEIVTVTVDNVDGDTAVVAPKDPAMKRYVEAISRTNRGRAA